ncbi:hypothetical protein KUCAC02_011391, partial [Chaenocephalus aceratus]
SRTLTLKASQPPVLDQSLNPCANKSLLHTKYPAARSTNVATPEVDGPISGAGVHRWDVTSAAVVSGLECYRLTIGTIEHS